jgi:hypothetical protein
VAKLWHGHNNCTRTWCAQKTEREAERQAAQEAVVVAIAAIAIAKQWIVSSKHKSCTLHAMQCVLVVVQSGLWRYDFEWEKLKT